MKNNKTTTVQRQCGPSYLPEAVNSLLFGWFFNTSCVQHDENYDKGSTESDRYNFDKIFLKSMVEDVKELPVHQKIVALPLAVIYFTGVRLLGWINFSYKD